MASRFRGWRNRPRGSTLAAVCYASMILTAVTISNSLDFRPEDECDRCVNIADRRRGGGDMPIFMRHGISK